MKTRIERRCRCGRTLGHTSQEDQDYCVWKEIGRVTSMSVPTIVKTLGLTEDEATGSVKRLVDARKLGKRRRAPGRVPCYTAHVSRRKPSRKEGYRDG